MMRVPYETMVDEFNRVLVKKGFTPERAKAAAEIFAQNSLAGVYSHGLNRFPRVVEYLEKGEIDPEIVRAAAWGDGALGRTPGLWAVEREAGDGSGVCAGEGVRHWYSGPGE